MKIVIESSLKKRHEYTVMFWIGVAIFIISNQYFGWNRIAQSGAERVCDLIWQFFVILGGFGMATRSLIEEAFKDTTHSIKEKI